MNTIRLEMTRFGYKEQNFMIIKKVVAMSRLILILRH